VFVQNKNHNHNLVYYFYPIQHVFIQSTKQHLFSTRLSRYMEQNTTVLHALSLSYGSLVLRYEPGSTGTRTDHTPDDWLLLRLSGPGTTQAKSTPQPGSRDKLTRSDQLPNNNIVSA
jgi:hypothetical protein